jgi:hypothetical protein
MNSDFPEFDKSYLKLMLPEDPDQFDLLAAKANFGIYRHDLWHGTGRRFAELIVKECMEWCDAHATIDGSAQQIRNSIKNHFGVEE